jgi:SAM-dependent methyltransferase
MQIIRAAYDRLAPLYDAWQRIGRTTPFAVLAARRLLTTLERTLDPEHAGSFLDLGCGTGTLLLELHRRHPDWRLSGLDASPAMLAEARRKAAAAGTAVDITWIEAELPHGLDGAPPTDPFAAAGAFFDALNHLPDEAHLTATFAAVARRLAPGGLFIFDLTNAAGYRRWWRDERRWRLGDTTLTVDMRFDAATGLAHATIRVVDDRGERTEEMRQRFFPDDEVTLAARRAGFEILESETWSPFLKGIAGKNWWIARKG